MNPQYEPKTLQQKLGYLIEEAGEVQAAVGKTIRWGLESYNPELPEPERETNREWILREIVDLKRAIVLVEEELTGTKARPSGAQLRARRKAARLTMAQLADALGCRILRVSDIELERGAVPTVTELDAWDVFAPALEQDGGKDGE